MPTKLRGKVIQNRKQVFLEQTLPLDTRCIQVAVFQPVRISEYVFTSL